MAGGAATDDCAPCCSGSDCMCCTACCPAPLEACEEEEVWREGEGSGWLLLASGGSWCGLMQIMKTGGRGARGRRLISRASSGVRLLSGRTQCCITGTEEGAGAEEG